MNHTVVRARDRDASAFLIGILGLDPPIGLGPFAAVRVSADTTVDIVETGVRGSCM